MAFDNEKWTKFREQLLQQSEPDNGKKSVDDLIASTKQNKQLDLDKFIPPVHGHNLDPQA